MGKLVTRSARWRVFLVYLLMWGIHLVLSLIAHCGLIGWYSVHPGSGNEILADGSRFLSLSVGLPTYLIRTHFSDPKSDLALLKTTAICIPIDCSVFALLYTWGYLTVTGFVRRSRGS